MRETFSVRTVLTKEPDVAAQFIRSGGIAAFPTETVYGLGANVFNEAAVQNIFEAKKRPADNPLIAHISSLDQIDMLAIEVNRNAKKLIERFFPGPLTVVLKKRDAVPANATARLDSIGVRMPRNKIARQFLAACGTPVVAPSANLSGRPSPTTWQAVNEDLNGRIDCILQGDSAEIGLESTVVDCRSDIPIVLRLGAISFEEIREVASEAERTTNEDAAQPRSPGIRHRHYTPRARVKIFAADEITDTASAAYIGLNEPGSTFGFMKVLNGIDEYAKSLYEFFRECDRRGIDTIFCEPVERVGIGAALMDRIDRASAAGD